MANEYGEFQRNYLGGWGKIRLPGESGLTTFKVVAFGAMIKEVHVRFINREGVPVTTAIPLDHILRNVTWFFPESKYVNTSNFVVRCVAYPARQYQKALTSENSYFSDALPFRISSPLKEMLEQRVTDVLNNFDKEYPTYGECLEDLRTGKAVARAFAKRFLLVEHPKCPYPLLVYKNTLIGYDRGDLLVCSMNVEKLNDTLINYSRKGVVYNESR